MKASSLAVAAALIIASAGTASYAGPNDFFGNSVGGSAETQQSAGTVDANGRVQTPGNPPVGEYSQDEKRMQHKYKDNVHRQQKLLNRAEDMMRSKDEKIAKKGKVLKEVAEKALAELRANNPFPELAATPKKVN